MRAGLVRVFAGPASAATQAALKAAENSPTSTDLELASEAFDRLPSIDRRRVLSTLTRL